MKMRIARLIILTVLIAALTLTFTSCDGFELPFISGENPSENPEENPEENPSENPEENPEDNPSENPSDNPDQNPDDTTEEERPATEGLVYTLQHDDTYSVTDYNGTATEVVIPSTYEGKPVTSIGYEAFSNCHKLTSVVIPDSVTSIGERTFDNCDGLTSIEIPEGVISIGKWAFRDCYSLTSIVIPDSVTSIGAHAFYGCSSLTSIKYRGTEEQWDAISKDTDWDYGTGDYTITFGYGE